MLAPQHEAQSTDSGQDPGTPPTPAARLGEGTGTLSRGPGRRLVSGSRAAQGDPDGAPHPVGSVWSELVPLPGSTARELTISAPHFALRSSFPRPRYPEGDSNLDCTLKAARARHALALESLEKDTTHYQRPNLRTLLTRVGPL